MIITESHLLEGAEQTSTPNVGGDIVPKFIVLRYFDDDLLNVSKEMQNAKVKRSTHLLITKGRVVQLAPFTTKSWGVGASYWKGHTDLNSCSITIGVVRDFEMGTLVEVLSALVERYRIREILGRDEVCIPWGAVSDDPSFDIWPLKELAVFDNAGGEGQYVSVMNNLPIYGGPSPHFPVLASLNRGDSVKVLKFRDGWALVAYDTLRGWICDGFLMKS